MVITDVLQVADSAGRLGYSAAAGSIHTLTRSAARAPTAQMAARRLGLRALSVAAPLLSGGAAGSCNGAVRGFVASAAAEGLQAADGGLLRRSAARHQWQLLPLLGGARGFAQLPPHIELTMPSLSPTMERVRVC